MLQSGSETIVRELSLEGVQFLKEDKLFSQTIAKTEIISAESERLLLLEKKK